MKILLLGEYSGVHTNLKDALKEAGHDVLLISNGDGYKAFDSDIYIKYKYFHSKNYFFQRIINLYYILLMYSGFKGIFQILYYRKIIKEMQDFDVVQLINPIFLSDYGTIVNLLVFNYLKKNNKKIFLQALGDDYIWVKYCLEKNFEYSIFNNLNFKNLKKYSYPLHYVYGFLNPYLNKYIVKNVNAIIPGLFDYYAAYKEYNNCTEIVPIIMKLGNNSKIREAKYPIKIFHGWQPGKEIRKGNHLFDIALKRLEQKYPEKVLYQIVGGIPYKEYKTKFEDADIFVDQCYSQDCGVNALLGMANGKVVCSGFEKEVKNYYNLDSMPLINSIPNVEIIFQDIEELVIHPSKIIEYSERAIKFIELFHNAKYVLQKYERIWLNY